MAALRRFVSGSRRRFVTENFDLDLTYVTERIIVMGFPAVGIEAFYRNPRKKVLKFLSETHKDHHLVFNLCHEEKHQYDPKIFAHEKNPEGAICVPFEDHSVPRLQQMAFLTYKAVEWLDADDENVVVIHCKAGKGRSGLMCCALLMAFLGLDADAALKTFAETRSVKNEGITINSQEKWIRMFCNFLPKFHEFAGPRRQTEEMLEVLNKQVTKKRKIARISVENIPAGKKFFLRIERRGNADDRDSSKNKPFPKDWLNYEAPNMDVELKQDLYVQEDFALFVNIDGALELRAWFCLELPEHNNAEGELILTNAANEVDVPANALDPEFKISLTLLNT